MPTVLSLGEVQALLAAVEPQYQLMAEFLYTYVVRELKTKAHSPVGHAHPVLMGDTEAILPALILPQSLG